MSRVESRQFRVESPHTAHSRLSTVDCELLLTEGFDTRDVKDAKAPGELQPSHLLRQARIGTLRSGARSD